MNIAEPFLRQALAAPDRPALMAGSRVVSYGTLLANARHVAARLHDAGVRPGDRVAVLTGPIRLITSTLALALLGAVSVEVAGTLSREAVESLAKRLGINFLFHNREQDYSLD